MAVKIVVLSDGTWETLGNVKVLTISEDSYDDLLDGIKVVNDLDSVDVLDSQEVQ